MNKLEKFMHANSEKNLDIVQQKYRTLTKPNICKEQLSFKNFFDPTDFFNKSILMYDK